MKRLKTFLQFNLKYIILGIFIFFYVIFFTKVIFYKSKYTENVTNISGIVTKINFDGDKLSLLLKAKEKIIVNYYFKAKAEKNAFEESISLGDVIEVKGKITKSSNNTIPNTFNYKKYLYNLKIYNIFNASEIKVIKKGNIIYKIKDYLYKRAIKLDKNGIYLTFILGDKSKLSEDDMNAFRENGISHLLAISGMHIAILLLCINKIFKKHQFIISILFLLFFVFLTGFTASILRASLFYILKNLFKNLSNMKILFLTGAILLIINPFFIYDLGFVYSFIVTFGIIYYNDKITGSYFKKLLKLSIISFLFSLPITINCNYEINFLSIIINLLFVPLISFFIYPFSLISFIFPVFNPVFLKIVNIMNLLNRFLLTLKINIITPKIGVVLIIFYYLVLIGLKHNKKLIVSFLIFGILYFVNFDSATYIYYLDVGQGDSIVIKNKEKVIMIDTGGNNPIKKDEWQKRNNEYMLISNTITFLKSIGIRKIDYLILTHGDYDHMGETINLVNNFNVEKVIFNNNNYNELEKDVIKILENKHINYYKGLKELSIKNNKLQFLNTKEYGNENDDSNVLFFKINNYKFLFMGDAGVEREKDILEKYNLTNIDFIKIGHHGSNTSSSQPFIDKIKPKNCLISVGKNNRYGHPKEEVLNTLDDYCNIYRTDLNGSIEIKINKNNYKIRTYNP